MSMTYVEIQDAVLSGSFNESKRASAKLWIKARHSWLWDAESWTFKHTAPVSVTFTSNSQVVNLGSVTDFHSVIALYDSQGDPVKGVRDLREFFDNYNTLANTASAPPESYTVIDESIYVGPKGDGSSGLLVYEKAKPSLVSDSDSTGLPDDYDLALVHGAKAEGFKLNNVPMAQAFDDDFNAFLNALRRNYLNKVREQGQQWGAYRVR